jgi:RIO kinase 1
MTEEQFAPDSAADRTIDFTFDYRAYEDRLGPGQRWSTWLEVEP